MLTTTTPDLLESFLAVTAGTTLRASVTTTPDRSPRSRLTPTFLVLGTKRRRPVRAVKLRIGLAPTESVDAWLAFDAMLRQYAEAVRILDARARAGGGRAVPEHNEGIDGEAVPEICTTDLELIVALDAAPY